VSEISAITKVEVKGCKRILSRGLFYGKNVCVLAHAYVSIYIIAFMKYKTIWTKMREMFVKYFYLRS
jgi:hypothetical protein